MTSLVVRVFNLNDHGLDATLKEAMVSRLLQISRLHFLSIQARILKYHNTINKTAVWAKSAICFGANVACLAWNTDAQSENMLVVIDL